MRLSKVSLSAPPLDQDRSQPENKWTSAIALKVIVCTDQRGRAQCNFGEVHVGVRLPPS